MLYLELGRNDDSLGPFGNELEIQDEGLRSSEIFVTVRNGTVGGLGVLVSSRSLGDP